MLVKNVSGRNVSLFSIHGKVLKGIKDFWTFSKQLSLLLELEVKKSEEINRELNRKTKV